MDVIPISQPVLGQPEENAVLRVLRSGHLAQGPEVEAFEREFALLCGTRYAVACSSGTAALQMALTASGVEPGAEVILPAFTFAATATAVLSVGAKPVFCDVSIDDLLANPQDIERCIGPRTKAIIPVHLYGQMADMDSIMDLARRHSLAVIEDACQALGARHSGKSAGSIGTAAAFSTYATKNITTGEGGILTTQSADVARRARLLRNHGMTRPYVHDVFGLNLRMTDLQGAIGRAQLARLTELNALRARNASCLETALSNLRGVTLLTRRPNQDVHAWHQFTLRIVGEIGRRTRFQNHLAARGIESRIYYPVPLHHQGLFATADSLPCSERASQEVLSVPVHPTVSPRDLHRIVRALVEADSDGF